MIELLIESNGQMYAPVVVGEIGHETERQGAPGKLAFSVMKEPGLVFDEGSAVSMKVDGHKAFYGFVFRKGASRADTIDVVAYDQLRYLKNKDTYVYKAKTAADVVRMVSGDFQLNLGTVEDTGFVIESRVEDNKTLFDIIQTALDLTLKNTKRMYVLYDDFGHLCLQDVESMQLDLLIDAESGQNYEYVSSIDEDTYNQVKLIRENEETGNREVFLEKDSSNINKWGVLQYFDTIEEQSNGQAMAAELLGYFNRVTKTLTVEKAFGDPRVRAGCSVAVRLDLGDMKVGSMMVVERVKHRYAGGFHTMDLILQGGEFVV